MEPQPVQVCRLTPPKPKAGGISVAPGTCVAVTVLSVCWLGLKAFPSRNNSASNLPGPQLFSTDLTVASSTCKRLVTGVRLGASPITAPTFKSRFGHPSMRCPTQPVPGFGEKPGGHILAESSTVEWQSAHWIPID